jgi:hypothetical protein
LVIYRTDALARIHGGDERESIDDLARGSAWCEPPIRRSAGEAFRFTIPRAR